MSYGKLELQGESRVTGMYMASHGELECTGRVTGNCNVQYESRETGMYMVSHGKLECTV